MNEIELLKKLGAAEGRHLGQAPDVADAVLRQIAGAPAPSPAIGTSAVGACLAAAAVATIAWQAWAAGAEPLRGLLDSTTEIMR